MTQRLCAACGAPDLELGFLVESVGKAAMISTWLRGRPEFHRLGGLKLRGKERYYTEAYGCRECGYLNMYVGVPLNSTTSP